MYSNKPIRLALAPLISLVLLSCNVTKGDKYPWESSVQIYGNGKSIYREIATEREPTFRLKNRTLSCKEAKYNCNNVDSFYVVSLHQVGKPEPVVKYKWSTILEVYFDYGEHRYDVLETPFKPVFKFDKGNLTCKEAGYHRELIDSFHIMMSDRFEDLPADTSKRTDKCKCGVHE